MPRHSPRDETVERMLRDLLKPSSRGGAPVGRCLDGETLAAWMEGTLPPAEAVYLETHAAVCPRCQALIASFARTHPAGRVAESAWWRWHLRWLVPLAAAATTVAIWMNVPATPPPAAPAAETDAQASFRAPEPEQAAPSLVAPPPAASTPGNVSPPDTSQQAAAKEAPASALERLEVPERREDSAAPSRAAEADQLAQTLKPSSPAAPAPSTSATPEAASAPSATAETVTLAGRAEALLRREAPGPIEIVSPAPAIRWRILPGGAVERSTNGGERWDAATLPAPGLAPVAGSSPAASVCWLVGRGGSIRLTTDGVSFLPVPFPEQVDLISVRASSAVAAVVTASDGRQFRTDDQGRTWTRVP